MDVNQFLAPRGLSLDAFGSALRDAIGLSTTDALLAVGSLVEGLGNTNSDLDFILISGEVGPHARTEDLSLVINGLVVDVQVIRLQDVLDLARRLETWVAKDYAMTHAPERDSGSLRDSLRTLHRISTSIPIAIGTGCQLSKNTIDPRWVARLKYQWARHLARTIVVDLKGFDGCGDWCTMVVRAQDLLEQAFDALLATHGLTNPTSKWRLALLRRLPQEWAGFLGGPRCPAAADVAYWNLMRIPEAPEREAALSYTLKIISIARRIFLLGDHHYAGCAQPEWRPVDLDILRSGIGKTAYLELDVDVMLDGGEYLVGRLNAESQPIRISANELELMLWLDGSAGSEGAVHSAGRGKSQYAGAVDVEDTIKRLDNAGLLRR